MEAESEEGLNIIEFDQEVELKKNYVLIHEFLIAEDNATCRLGKMENGYVVEMEAEDKSMKTFRMEYHGGEKFVATSIESPTIFRFAMWMAYCLKAGLMNRTLIHASTIVYDGKAVLFLGESGTGKSTHTRLWREYIPGSRLLNDDSPVLSYTERGVLASGSPWSGKTPCYHNITFPVAGIVRLQQAKVNEIERLDVLHAVAALQPSLPPSFAYDSFYQGKMLDLISDVVEHVPVYKLRCLPDEAAARMSFETIMKKQ